MPSKDVSLVGKSADSKKSVKKPKLKEREAKYVKAKLEGLSNTQAAMVATGTTSVNSAKTLGHRLSTSVNVQEAMEIAMQERGLTADAIAQVVADGMKAEKVVIVGKDEDAFADVQPDHSIRLKAASMAGKYLGLEKNEGSGGNTFNFNFSENKNTRKYIDA